MLIPGENSNLWELDFDEKKHINSISKKYFDLLDLTVDGAVLSQAISAEASTELAIKDKTTILSILVLKTVEEIRLAVEGILFGHYSAVPILLRTIIDSISVLHLTCKNERQYKIWILLSYINHRVIEVDENMKREYKSWQTEFAFNARNSYNNLFSKDPDMREVTDYIAEFSSDVHPDIFGLFNRAGVKVDIEEIFGKSIRQALAVAKGNPSKAIDLLEIQSKNKFGDNESKTPFEKDITFGPGIIEQGLLEYYSQIVHSASHHLFDVVEYYFGEYASNSTMKAGKEWHMQSEMMFGNEMHEDG